MASVLLINPAYTYFGGTTHIQFDEPLGLMFLAAYVRQKGHEVRIFDALRDTGYRDCGEGFQKCGLSNEELQAELAAMPRPDVVGITSMFTMHSKGVHDTTAVVKRVWPGVLVVVGGSHASALPDWVLADANIDLVVRGEGEFTLEEILQRRARGEPVDGLAGTIVRQGGKVVHNPDREFRENLDELPLPARDLVDMKTYLAEPYRNRVAMDTPRANLVTSRGCPCRCVFCSIHSIWRNSYRARSPQQVVDEIEMLVKTYGVREVAFQDDNLTLNPKRMIAICDELVRRRIRIRWCTPNGVAIWTLGDELIGKMAAAGCYKVTFGIETGCAETQKFIGKQQIKLDKCGDIIRKCNRTGMWTHSSFIIGFPFETPEQVEETVAYAVASDLDFAAFFVATPFPGTPLFDVYREHGLLPDLGDSLKLRFQGHQSGVFCDTKHFKKENLEAKIHDAYGRFYRSRVRKFLNPVRPLRKIKGWPELRYFWKLYQLYRTEYKNLA
jgi:anaerobic magnesium-protoporphyrin IX monomethyl ester cyclase